ncbi:uncharacterized protein [Rutidosis leptorrhynchoides]|uniref:uncharacterized protein n=1 Tax=Rutidosis leptorrhynchoides TaxID=125765 RepID=UPI003A9A62AA
MWWMIGWVCGLSEVNDGVTGAGLRWLQKVYGGGKLSVIAGKPNFSPSDWNLIAKHRAEGSPIPMRKDYLRQQGLAESIFRNMRVGFGKWEFYPIKIENPFPNHDGSVHL